MVTATILMLLLMLTACNSTQEPPYLAISANDGAVLDGRTIDIPTYGDSITFRVASNTMWRVESQDEWVELSTHEGNGNGEVNLNIGYTTQSRSTVVEIYVVEAEQMRESFCLSQHYNPLPDFPSDSDSENTETDTPSGPNDNEGGNQTEGDDEGGDNGDQSGDKDENQEAEGEGSDNTEGDNTEGDEAEGDNTEGDDAGDTDTEEGEGDNADDSDAEEGDNPDNGEGDSSEEGDGEESGDGSDEGNNGEGDNGEEGGQEPGSPDSDNTNPEEGNDNPSDNPSHNPDDGGEAITPTGDYYMVDKLSQLREGEYYIGGYQGSTLHLATEGMSTGHCNTTPYTFTSDGSLSPQTSTEAITIRLEAAPNSNSYYIRFPNGYLTAKASGAGQLQITEEKSHYWIFSAHPEQGFVVVQSAENVQIVISAKATNGSLLRSMADDEEGTGIVLIAKNN